MKNERACIWILDPWTANGHVQPEALTKSGVVVFPYVQISAAKYAFMNLMRLEQYCTVYFMPVSVYILCLFPTLLLHSHPHAALSMNLHVLAHHGNHEIEQTNSLNEGETQNGVREELSSHAWVAGYGRQESSEHHADTDSGTTETDSC